jgi:hypothetical protein
MNANTRNALDYVGFKLEHTGGNCTAWRLSHGIGEDGERYTLITVYGEPVAPSSLRAGPVVVGGYEGENGDAVQTLAYPTLAHALLDIYGPAEGEPLPAALVPCRVVVESTK